MDSLQNSKQMLTLGKNSVNDSQFFKLKPQHNFVSLSTLDHGDINLLQS